MTHEFDIIVVGAGLVGLSSAIAFAQMGKNVVLVDAKKSEIKKARSWDERIYTMTPATESWLKELGVWQLVDTARVNEIHAMHLRNDASESPLILADSDANLPKLGLIVENRNLLQAMWQKLCALDVKVIANAPCKHIDHDEQHIYLHLQNDSCVVAKLLVAADGAQSFVRQAENIAINVKPFNQTAIVANFLAEKNHRNIARQWFAPHETLAFLPLPAQHVSMVWSVSTERATELLMLTREQLAQRVQAQSNDMLGTLKSVSEVLSFPLNQSTATQLIAERVVLVGDAAHQVHPMAGQGVNLGFRDVMAVQKLLANTHALQDIGEWTFLRQYERVRKADISSMNGLTSGLDALFASEQGILKKLGTWGMSQLNSQAAAKKALIKQAVA